MTDPEIADRAIEPLTCEVVGRVIQQENLMAYWQPPAVRQAEPASELRYRYLDRESVQVLEHSWLLFKSRRP